MPEDTIPADEMTFPQALGVVDTILKTQYAGFKKLEAVLRASLAADETLQNTNALIAHTKEALAALDGALAKKTADAQAVLDRLGEQIQSAADTVKDAVNREYESQRAKAKSDLETANAQLTALLGAIEVKTDELAELKAQLFSAEIKAVEYEGRADAAERRIDAAKQALVDAQAHF